MNNILRTAAFAALAMATVISCSDKKWKSSDKEQFNLITQKNGRTLGYSKESGISIIEQDGYAFKDLDKNGLLDPYEDWRLSSEERAKDLASKLSTEEIAGLMLYSIHQAVPNDSVGFWSSTYNGTTLDRSKLPHSAVSDRQKDFIRKDNLRAVLIVRVESPKICAEWNNNIQAYAEGIGFGVPVNISSDPRNEANAEAEYNAGAGGMISLWPTSIGLAATFSPDLVEEFGTIASKEYRALGVATALSPQIDMATDPRWTRFNGTFGEDSRLDTDMARAYVDGFQTSEGAAEFENGWGFESVNAMVKHWPGGGCGEGGRDAHYSYGKYSVYPAGNLNEQLTPFLNGAFRLKGETRKASAVMPYYTISYGLDPSGRNVGNSYSAFIVDSLLRKTYGYDGVVCTDWGITHDYFTVGESDGKCWGAEKMTEAQRHYEALKAGVDQFGGNNEKGPVMEAYKMWSEEFGEASARVRFERSAVRLLLNMFRTGLFDNPYTDVDKSVRLVGNPEYMKKGFDAQVKSIVMLKNHSEALPVKDRKKVYIPNASSSDSAAVTKYYIMTGKPEDADFAIAFINEPQGGCGYSVEDAATGGNGYLPINLQYSDYTAEFAREKSIAGGDPKEKSVNRSYKGKTVTTENQDDLTSVVNLKKVMGGKKVIVVVDTRRPFIPEFEPYADAVLLSFGTQRQAVMEIISGTQAPYGLLPMQMPSDMRTVEEQSEDLPHDMKCWIDSDGHSYDFAFGLDWSGVILDARVMKYAHRQAKAPYSSFSEGYLKDIEADGWLKAYLERQKSGMTGHPEALAYPYNSCLWAGEIRRNTESYGSDWWRYEQTAYYTDGLVRLGYLLKDKDLIDKGEEGIKYVFDHASENGVLGNISFSSAQLWPMCVFFRAIQAYYYRTRDESVPKALEKHYLNLTTEQIEVWRNIVSIEGMLWTYGLTGNPKLLEMSEAAYNSGKFGDLTPEVIRNDKKLFMHGVTCMEEMKLPMILYSYTGKQEYLDLALRADTKLETENMLPDGIPVSAEALYGNGNVINSHEVCDIADYTWTMGYFLTATGDTKWADRIEKGVFNAAPGAVTKDFKSLQYFSSVNQFIATGTSNHNEFFHGSTWMAYRPTHETECCSGNVNRIMPNYVSRMWLRSGEGDVVAALYGPSSFSFNDSEGKACKITEETGYPFEEEIRFIFSIENGKAEIPLLLRIPSWCDKASLKLNGKRLDTACDSCTFVRVSREFKDGDELRLSMDFRLTLKETAGNGVYVQWGPLVFSYAIPQKQIEDTAVYANMNGKVPENKDFKCWSLTPSGAWNYGLCYDAFDKDAKVVRTARKGYPLDDESVPVRIRVPVKKIEWNLAEDRYTPTLPLNPKVKEEKTESIELVPYGSTELRLTVFPKID